MLWVDGSTIPLSTSCKIQAQNQLADDGTKDDGEWDHQGVISKQWSVSNDSRLDTDGTTTALLQELYDDGEVVPIIIGKPANYNAQGVDAAGGSWSEPDELYLFGEAVIESVDFAGEKGDWATATVNFKGVGELASSMCHVIVRTDSTTQNTINIYSDLAKTQQVGMASYQKTTESIYLPKSQSNVVVWETVVTGGSVRSITLTKDGVEQSTPTTSGYTTLNCDEIILTIQTQTS